jgi:hypothetical protein
MANFRRWVKVTNLVKSVSETKDFRSGAAHVPAPLGCDAISHRNGDIMAHTVRNRELVIGELILYILVTSRVTCTVYQQQRKHALTQEVKPLRRLWQKPSLTLTVVNTQLPKFTGFIAVRACQDFRLLSGRSSTVRSSGKSGGVI